MTSEPQAGGAATGSLPTIFPAEPGEREAIVQLLQACDLPTADLTPQAWPLFWVAHGAYGGIVGAVALELYPPDGLLRSLAVAPSYRGQGLAAELVARVLRESAARGLARLFLLTVTAADYFRPLGFADVPRDRVPPAIRGSAQFRTLCPQSAVCLCREKGQVPFWAILDSDRNRIRNRHRGNPVGGWWGGRLTRVSSDYFTAIRAAISHSPLAAASCRASAMMRTMGSVLLGRTSSQRSGQSRRSPSSFRTWASRLWLSSSASQLGTRAGSPDIENRQLSNRSVQTDRDRRDFYPAFY